MYLHIFLY